MEMENVHDRFVHVEVWCNVVSAKRGTLRRGPWFTKNVHLKPNGYYMYQVVWQQVGLHYAFMGFILFLV
jgi:hypothetical protein